MPTCSPFLTHGDCDIDIACSDARLSFRDQRWQPCIAGKTGDQLSTRTIDARALQLRIDPERIDVFLRGIVIVEHHRRGDATGQDLGLLAHASCLLGAVELLLINRHQHAGRQ